MKVQENVLPSIELLVLKRDGRKVSFEQDKIFRLFGGQTKN